MNSLDFFKEKGLLSAPAKILAGLEDTIRDITEYAVWGDAREKDFFTLDDVKKWFYQLPVKHKKKVSYGVIVKVEPIEQVNIRIFQGVFNKQKKVIVARQIIAKQLSDDLLEAFGCDDLIIFTETPRSI